MNRFLNAIEIIFTWREKLMGRDAFVHISKSELSGKAVEEFIMMQGFQKRGEVYTCLLDDEYKYYSPVCIYKSTETENELIYHVRTQACASSFDVQKQNTVLRYFKKYCHAWFEGDMGKNRYFEVGQLLKGAESGCYFAVENLYNCFSLLSFSLSKYPSDNEAELSMREFGFPTPNSFNATVYSTYLCALIEDYFRETYIALLKFSDRKEKILNVKLSPYDLVEISCNHQSVEESFARTLSFQNISKIVHHFSELDKKLNLAVPLKKPFHNRKKNLFDTLDDILERRHAMVHRRELDSNYNCEMLNADIKNVKTAIQRVYMYICQCYGWVPQDIVL